MILKAASERKKTQCFQLRKKVDDRKKLVVAVIAAAAVVMAGGGDGGLVLTIAGVHGGAVASGRVLVSLLACVFVLQELDVGSG